MKQINRDNTSNDEVWTSDSDDLLRFWDVGRKSIHLSTYTVSSLYIFAPAHH